MALLYDMSTGLYGELAEKEQESWRTLQLLEGPGGPIGDDMVTVLLQAWINAKSQSKLIGVMALRATGKWRSSEFRPSWTTTRSGPPGISGRKSRRSRFAGR